MLHISVNNKSTYVKKLDFNLFKKQYSNSCFFNLNKFCILNIQSQYIFTIFHDLKHILKKKI